MPENGAASATPEAPLSFRDTAEALASGGKDLTDLCFADVLGENTSRREESVKVFWIDKNNSVSATYESRVHKLAANGEWTDIDNTLVLSGDAYTPKDGAFELELPRKQGRAVSVLSENGFALRWSWKDIRESEAVVVDTADKELLDNPFYLPNLTSGLLYADAFPSADLSVRVTTVGVKENIIIKSPEAPTVYSFTMDIGSLCAEQTDERTVSLLTAEGTVQYLLSAPLMKDAAGAISEALTLTLTEADGNTLTLTLRADPEWISAAERSFPVTLDPYIYSATTQSTVADNFITSDHPTANFGGIGHMYLGKEGYYGICRMLITFTLPTLSKGDTVVGAIMTLSEVEGGVNPSSATLQLEAYKITSSWTEMGSTWNSMHSAYDSSRIYDTLKATYRTSVVRHKFYLTELVKSWYSGTEVNNGVMVKWAEDTGNTYRRTVYYTSGFTGAEAYFPVLMIQFLSDVGLEGYRSYHEASAGEAGTAYINDYSGNLSFSAPLTESDGLLLPVSTGLFYSGYLSGQQSLNSKRGLTAGLGWTFSLSSRIDALANGGTSTAEQKLFTAVYNDTGATYRYVYRDSDATLHYLYKDGTVYKDEEGLGLTLSLDSASTAKRYRLDYKDGSYLFFDANGYLTYIYDSEGNYASLSYATSGSGSTLRKFVTSVTDGAGRVTTVSRNSSGFITSVTAPDGRVTTLSYQSGKLVSVTYPTGLTTSFTYDADSRLTEIVRNDGRKLCVTYRSGSSLSACEKNRVIKLCEYGSDGTGGNYVCFDYKSDSTTEFTYSVNGSEVREISAFDHYGRTVSVTDPDTGAASDLSYTAPASPNGSTNKLSAISEKGETRHNLIENGSFERGGTGWSGYTEIGNEGLIGSHCAKFSYEAITQTVAGLECGELYTLSFYLKGNGPFIITESVSRRSVTLVHSGYTGWKRYHLTFIAGASGSTGITNAVIGLCCYAGTLCLDDVHLEKAAADSTGNLLENTLWNDLSRWETDGFTAGDGLSDGRVTVTGSLTGTKTLSQEVSINRAGIGFILSAKAEGHTLPKRPDITSREASIGLTFYYADGTEETVKESFNFDTAGLQYKSLAAWPSEENLEKIITKVRYTLTYAKTCGTLSFSDCELIPDESGTCYQYDPEGNLVRTSRLSEANQVYTYNSASEIIEASRSGDDLSEHYTYTYDSAHPHRLTAARSSESGIGLTFSYNSKGEVTETKAGSVSAAGVLDLTLPYLSSSVTYTSDGNYEHSVTDQAGNTVTYDRNLLSGLITKVTDPEGHETQYSYDTGKKLLSAVTSGGISVSYSYNADDLTLATVTSPGASYGFTYDEFGNLTGVTVGGETFVTRSYLPGNGSLGEIVFANGDEITYTYDRQGRPATETRGTDVYTYRYNSRGALAVILKNGSIESEFFYDLSDRLTNYQAGNLDVTFTYDELNRVCETCYRRSSSDSYRYTVTYGADSRVESVCLVGGADLWYTYDSLSRVTKTEFKNGESLISETAYTYRDLTGNQTTAQVESLTNRDGEGNPLSSYSYTYDGNGNIAAVTENGITTSYTYDSLNRLVSSETETELHEYSYDGAGNLLSKNYFGKVGDEWVLLDTDTYAYPAEGWQDLLISYNGESITYDELGNPLTYYGNRSFSWEGRELKTLTNGTTAASYTYNASGIRTSKTVNGVTTNFSLEGSRILFMTGGSGFWSFLYYGDVLAGFKVNNATYYYLRNLQGDIVQIIDASGNVVVSYRYDDWGKVLSVAGSAAETLGVQNPFRYRGYFYDEETGLYYLNARYYDPKTGRFVNEDSLISIGGDLTGTNLFVYCLNQPVNRADYDGLASMDVCDSELHVGPDDSPGDNYDGGGGGFYGGSGYTYSASVINDTFPTGINSGYNTHFNAESFSNLLDTAANMLVSCNFAFDNVGAAASQAVSCFAEGTLVLREDGPAEIEDVRVGDLVWATDPETGETALKRVVRIFRNETYEWLHLTVNGEEIICTPTHPFYSPVKGWIAACELRAGDILVTLNGEYVVLEVIQHELLESSEITYNFEVEGFHTYYVGAISVLVHNMCAKKADIKQVEDAAKKLKMTPSKRREFGDYIEFLKRGKRNDLNFSFKDLIRIGKDFIDKK